VKNGLPRRAAAASAAGLLLCLLAAAPSVAQSPTDDQGLKVFKSANCMGCHKWSGAGGGGYGGAAANLRQTSLSLDQIVETIRCGRPTTGMPHFEADAYSDGHCYGLKKSDLQPDQLPPEPDHPLREPDIEAVAKYVSDHIKGQGEVTLAQCQAFFGNSTRVCGVYAKQDTGSPEAAVQHAVAPQPGNEGPSEPASGGSHPRMKVDAASDANAAHSGTGR
jgi:hypothetical protein